MENRKRRIITFGCIFFVSILTYVNFITGYFSIDTDNIISLGYKGYAINYFLCDGRIFSAMFALIGELTKISLKNLYIISTILSIAISSISVMLIYKIIDNILKPENTIEKLILILLSYTYIFHFMSINDYEYFENCIISIGILLYIISAKKIIIDRKIVLGILLCIIATAMYQGTINTFITTSILFLLIQQKTKKEFWKDIAIVLGVTLISALINALTIWMAKININSTQTMRVDFNIIKNLLYNFSNLPSLIIDSLDLFPAYLHIGFILIMLLSIFIYCIRKKDMNYFFKSLFLVVIAYGSCIALCTIYPTCIYSGNGRIFASVGSSFSALGIFALCSINICEAKRQKVFFTTLIILYFLAIIGNTIYITDKMKEQNKIDERFSNEIVEEIQQYETKTGVEVKRFAILYYEDINGKDKEVLGAISRRSKIQSCLYSDITLKIYTGKELEYEGFEEKIEEEYFNQDENKMMCIGDKLYIKQAN